jgi:ribonucleoside-diphosphate reductase alpha chain
MAQIPRLRPISLSENALVVLRARYLRRDDQRRIIETPEELFWRVASAVAEADRLYDPQAEVTRTAEAFYDLMASLEFLPNTPTLINAGQPLGQLMACFVLPIEDSIEGILDTLKHAAIIQKTGGGTGFAFSRIRPAGDIIRSTKGLASGPLSFLLLYDTMTEVIKQGSTRRGANMGILRVDHPDILDFIDAKRDVRRFRNFNLSVGVTDAFMQAVQRDEVFALVNPRNGAVWRRLPAREIWDRMITNAWETGEPGAIFLDTINRHQPTPELGQIEATNPCGEMPLLPYEACCLGSINLSKMWRQQNGTYVLDLERLGRAVDLAVHFLDNVIDVNRYPLPETRAICLGNRKIGLGVMGFHDLLIRLGIPYDSEEGLRTAEQVMGFIKERALAASARLAEQRGPFPNLPRSLYARQGLRLRNATRTTIAPTGTISIIANCSSGIEPLFAIAYVRRVLEGQELRQEIHPIFIELAERYGFASPDLFAEVAAHGTVQHLTQIPEWVRRLFVTALDIAPEWHVRMQAAFQKHTDNAVSKTINLPQEATPDDVRRAYELAYQLGCKGITVYRYGSRPHQVLTVQAYCASCASEDALPEEPGATIAQVQQQGIGRPRRPRHR